MKPRFVTCVIHSERGDLISGDSNGTVYVWGNMGNTITNFIKHAHEVIITKYINIIFFLFLLRQLQVLTTVISYDKFSSVAICIIT